MLDNNSPNRIMWIDNMRAIAILSIMGGHFYQQSIFSLVIGSFWVSIFFFISGYLYREEASIAVFK